MKVLIISDSHGNSNPILSAIEKEKPEVCVFLGDGLYDIETAEMVYRDISFYKVSGNCDFSRSVPRENVTKFDDISIFYTHGHLYDVKTNKDDLISMAKNKKADIALFGHSHIPFYDYTNGVHLFNPGSITFPRRSKYPSYGIIHITQNMPSFEIVDIK